MIKTIFFISVAGVSGAIACEDTQNIALTAQDAGAPRAMVKLGEIPLAQPFSAQIDVCDGGAITEFELDAIMPAHQHGMNYVPDITDLGSGSFRADGLVFHMPGVWELQIEVTQETGVNYYTHTVTVR